MKVKRLIPAVAMLLVSAMLLGTSTFAWFSMNTQVTANSIAITAKSNARYLLINDDGTAADGDTSLTITTDAEVYPAYYSAAAGTMAGTAFGGASLVTAADTWYTANNKNTNNATNATMNVHTVAEGDADYMATDTMYLTLSADSEDWAYYVHVTVAKASGDAAGKMVVKYSTDGGTTYTKVDVGVGDDFYIDCTTDNLTNAGCIEIIAYTYIDGTSTNVYSDFTGAPSSITATFGFTFDLTESNT